ncbi:MAG: polysulfide reductase NrfD [Deltaproteobacteria bacterium]|nr:polysulfide reductase NrfD [Deltaproteobacteria bacterium]
MSGTTAKPQLLTPFNVIAGIILLFGAVIVVLRYINGLAYATNLTQDTTWGLWTGFKLVFVALAASGYTLTTAVYIFGMKEYHVLVRPAVLAGFLGYTLFILILLFDLGRAWRIYYPFLIQAGPTSALFEIALCVALYYTTQFLELTPVGFEWLRWKRWRRFMVSIVVGLTIFGLFLSMLHQSTLGALFLTVPGKVHPLWYSSYIPLHFFMSSALGGVSMVILIGLICRRVWSHKMEVSREKLDELTVGLGKAGAITMLAYFAVKVTDVALMDTWHYIFTPMGLWYLLEMVGFVLLPCLLYALGYRERRPRLIRLTAVLAVLGVILNRLNVSVIAFNWQLPYEQRYFPHWMEYVTVLFLITLGIVVFKFVSDWFAIVHDHPDYQSHH